MWWLCDNVRDSCGCVQVREGRLLSSLAISPPDSASDSIMHVDIWFDGNVIGDADGIKLLAAGSGLNTWKLIWKRVGAYLQQGRERRSKYSGKHLVGRCSRRCQRQMQSRCVTRMCEIAVRWTYMSKGRAKGIQSPKRLHLLRMNIGYGHDSTAVRAYF
ncbi:hypothetical protein OG21DRAFT_1308006 [Imleria badia]|nr:hypothetical protein OG21DRAFT_1308006 [Imleria badia]